MVLSSRASAFFIRMQLHIHMETLAMKGGLHLSNSLGINRIEAEFDTVEVRASMVGRS